MAAQGVGNKAKKRAENWQFEEKDYLFELIKENASVIENKRTDAGINRKKNEAWNNVEQAFTVKHGTKRTQPQLKQQWKTLKIQAKKDISDFGVQKRKTGGGPPPKEPKAISLAICELLPGEFKQLNNPYDDDVELQDVSDDTETRDM